MVWHIVNLITAQQCDFVFSSEPISVLKYKELGIESFFVPIEADGKVFKDHGLKKYIKFYILVEIKLLEVNISTI